MAPSDIPIEFGGRHRRHGGPGLLAADLPGQFLQCRLQQRPDCRLDPLQMGDLFQCDGHRVGQPGQIGRGARAMAPALTGAGQCEEVASQVTAVDRRDIFRLERMQVIGSIPIQEMAAKPLQAGHGRHRRFEPANGIGEADPAEIVRADGG
jgi:hypothetical protein